MYGKNIIGSQVQIKDKVCDNIHLRLATQHMFEMWQLLRSNSGMPLGWKRWRNILKMSRVLYKLYTKQSPNIRIVSMYVYT